MQELYEKSEKYLSDYLKQLKNKDGSFKRVCMSPLRYAGGKSKAVGLILSNLPKLKMKRIVSPFFGGGSFELCASHELGIEVIGYDIFGMLTNFWNVIINDATKAEFIRELRKFTITQEEFTYNRHLLLHYWDKIKPIDLNYKTQKVVELKPEDTARIDSSPLMQAVYYYYNMILSYGPMFLGWPSSNEINKDKFDRRIAKLEQTSFQNLRVECSDFESVIAKHADDFIFLDPPYYLEGDSKMFKGMYPNSTFQFTITNSTIKKCATC